MSDPLSNIPGVNPDGTVSTRTMRETLADPPQDVDVEQAEQIAQRYKDDPADYESGCLARAFLALAAQLAEAQERNKQLAGELVDRMGKLRDLRAQLAERDREILKDVLWLIDCERDAAQTTGGKLDAIENIERRIRGHFHLAATHSDSEERPRPPQPAPDRLFKGMENS